MTLRSLSVLLLLAACGVEAEDGELDSLSQNGKADGGFSETELAAAVRVANELSLAQLDHDVPLSARAAKNIVAHRAGADGVDGTGDDDRFDDAAEVDAVSYVGPVAFAAMIDYAQSTGMLSALPALTRNKRPWEYIADGFGETLALGDDGTMYVGAPTWAGDTATYPGLGGIYMYPRTATGWGAPTILKVQPDANQNAAIGFGGAFSLDGDTLVVAGHRRATFGTPPDVVRVGSNPVSIFERSGGTWSMSQMLLPDQWNEGFGSSVSLDGDTLVVGAPHYDNTATCDGAVYVYKKSATGWNRTAMISNPSAVSCSTGPGRYFGTTVEVAGSSLFVASPTEPDATGLDVGAVYVYNLTSLTTAPKRLQPTGVPPYATWNYPAAYFGSELSVDGDTLAIAARGYDSVFVYRKSSSTWTLAHQITIDVKDRLGYVGSIRSVAVDGNRILVGAHSATGYTGAVFMFGQTSSGWTETGTTTPPGSRQTQFFGTRVALRGDRVAVGASGATPYIASTSQLTVPGAVYSN